MYFSVSDLELLGKNRRGGEISERAQKESEE